MGSGSPRARDWAPRIQKWEETEPRGPRGDTVGSRKPTVVAQRWGSKGLGVQGQQTGHQRATDVGESAQTGASGRGTVSVCGPLPLPQPHSPPGLAPQPVGRLSRGPPLPSATCLPTSPTRTDLSWPPLAPPLPSRRLRRILQLLPKLFPLIPSSAATAASHAARPNPTPASMTSSRSSAPSLYPTLPSRQQPITAPPGNAPDSATTPTARCPGPPAAPSGVRYGHGNRGQSWRGSFGTSKTSLASVTEGNLKLEGNLEVI